MALSPDGKMLATAGQDHFARLLDTENFKVLHEFEHPADVNGIVFSNDNKTLLTGCGDAAIRVFDVASSKEIRKLEGHTKGSVTDLEFSPDGKFLASGAMDRTVRIWDLVDFERPKLKSTVGGFNDIGLRRRHFSEREMAGRRRLGRSDQASGPLDTWKKNGRGSGDFNMTRGFASTPRNAAISALWSVL